MAVGPYRVAGEVVSDEPDDAEVCVPVEVAVDEDWEYAVYGLSFVARSRQGTPDAVQEERGRLFVEMYLVSFLIAVPIYCALAL